MIVHGWGSNSYNQISAQTQSKVYSPTAILEIEGLDPVSIATGDAHTLILTESGDVYSFGRGKEGQLGHNERSSDKNPKLIEGLRHETVTSIACGSITSFAITAAGRIYQW